MARTSTEAKKVKCLLCKEKLRYNEALHVPTGFYHRADGVIVKGLIKAFHQRCYIIWSTLVENLRSNGRFEQMCHYPIELLILIKRQSGPTKAMLAEQGFEKLVWRSQAV